MTVLDMAERQAAPLSDDQAPVLIADDYPPNLTALRAVLEPLGQEVDSVGSGAMAIAAIERKDYALAILDVQMPPMNGPEVAKRIRAGKRNAGVPIMFLSAVDAEMPQVVDAYASGAVDFVQKPFDPRILRSKVSTFVELHRRGQRIKREAAARIREEVARAAAERASHEKDQFLAILGHELRTPLTALLLWSEQLVNKRIRPEALDRVYSSIHRCVRAEAHMAENVLEMGRIATGALAADLASVDMSAIVEAVVTELTPSAAETGTTILSQVCPSGCAVLGNAHGLRLLVYNLVHNALKFASGRQVGISLAREEQWVVMRIMDTGTGFTPGMASRLFDAFSQADSTATRPHNGLGLGLAVAKSIAERHGGSIVASSDGPGCGASFRLRLPAEDPSRQLPCA